MKTSFHCLRRLDADVGRLVRYFGNDARQVSAFFESSIRLTKFFTRRDDIRAAITILPSHYPNYFLGACVVEELTQIIRLPNDSTIVQAFIFNDRSQCFKLTANDLMLLRILYGPRITYAMARQNALNSGARSQRNSAPANSLKLPLSCGIHSTI